MTRSTPLFAPVPDGNLSDKALGSCCKPFPDQLDGAKTASQSQVATWALKHARYARNSCEQLYQSQGHGMEGQDFPCLLL
jgi:hypothetical protein